MYSIVHGGLSSHYLTPHKLDRRANPPPSKSHYDCGVTCSPGKERRFEAFAGSCDAGCGSNRYRTTSRPSSRAWQIKWDGSFKNDHIPAYSVYRDPFLRPSHLQQVAVTVHPRTPTVLESETEQWNRQVLGSARTMALDKSRERHPWPEIEPETAAPVCRRWIGFNPGPLTTRKVATPHGVPWFDGGEFRPPYITPYDAAKYPRPKRPKSTGCPTSCRF